MKKSIHCNDLYSLSLIPTTERILKSHLSGTPHRFMACLSAPVPLKCIIHEMRSFIWYLADKDPLEAALFGSLLRIVDAKGAAHDYSEINSHFSLD